MNFAESTKQVFREVTSGDFSGLMGYATTQLLPAMVVAAGGLACIFLGYLVAKYVSRMVSKPICNRVDQTLGKFAGKAVFYAIWFGVIGAVLSTLGVPLGGLAVMLAAAGFAVGLAFQGTLSNFAAGVLMLVFRPFKVGDVINAAGVVGKVDEIDFFTTTLDTPDNRRIIVPNSSIAGGTIENISFHKHRRIEVVVGVDYSADQDSTRMALQAAVDRLQSRMITGEDRGSAVVLSSLGDSAVEWKVRMWVNSADFFPMSELLTGEVKRQLDAVNIGIPFPQLDVHLNRIDEPEPVAQRSRPRRMRHDPAHRSTMVS
ncbi:MAG: mechanosensitive ion channel domain-containing protein [Planctomycetota bacterium]